MASPARLVIGRRDLGLVALALAIGIAIAWIDSRPGWDDTGITVGLLALGALLVAALDGRRAWLWTLLVGAPLPIVEVPGSGSAAPLVALLFAAVGAAIGLVISRAVRMGSSTA